ncbi:MAG: aminotransferase class I/II-fold pyridoxal phosphate-dependent enzyme [Rickettsiales bacterium]|nr:aminotransferase class I/II-fold pyridoxal phosphate-dependent enzyme [Rickettsiales bacterium]
MPALDDSLQQKLSLLESRHNRRFLHETARLEGVRVTRNGKEYTSFSCNDYLGLTHHPDVIEAGRKALEQYGAGAGASRLVTGDNPLNVELENALVAYKGTDAACLFGSGTLANLGTIPALVGKGDLILADRLSHACMLDGARLSGATVLRFAHNNLEHARMLLEANRREHQTCLILTETVFSMDGDRAPIQALHRLTREYDAWLMTDDAHGFGVLPQNTSPADIQMGTLSKAVGSYGGYVCGSKTLIDYLKNSARSLIFSTGLPPATLACSLAAVNIITKNPALVATPMQRAMRFTQSLGLEPATSAIVPVILKENDKALEAAKLLESRGYLVAAIRPPTVPENTARLRFAFSALHEDADIDAVAAIVKEQSWACA